MDYAEKSWLNIATAALPNVVVCRIEAIKRIDQPQGEESSGVLDAQVLRVIASGPVALPPRMDVGFLQLNDPFRRIKAGGQGWNGVDVRVGALLLMAFETNGRIAGSNVVQLSAVSEVASVQDALVLGLAEVIAIEREADASRRAAYLERAVTGTVPFVREYAHYAMGRLHRIPRNTAIRIEIALLANAERSGAERRAAAINLELELWQSQSPDDTHNKQIVGALFGALASVDADLQRTALSSLHRLLILQMPSDVATATDSRRRLLRGTQLPSDDSLRISLKKLASLADATAEAKAVSELLELSASRRP